MTVGGLLTRGKPALLLYAFRAAAALLIAYPVARVAQGSAPIAYPEGDAALFSPGGLELLEMLRLGGRPLAAAVQSGLLVGLVLAVLGLFPLAAALKWILTPH